MPDGVILIRSSEISEQLREALQEAMPFLYRARWGAKTHEQDKLDAEAWFKKWSDLFNSSGKIIR